MDDPRGSPAPAFSVSELWDADTYQRAGSVPFTFFLYPRTLADEQRLPRDADSVRFLAALHKSGVRVGIWGHAMFPTEYYFACPKDDIQRLLATVAELERQGEFPQEFARERCEYFDSLIATATDKTSHSK